MRQLTVELYVFYSIFLDGIDRLPGWITERSVTDLVYLKHVLVLSELYHWLRD